jgi:hypothetical protein
MNQTIILTVAVALMAIISTSITYIMFKKLSSFTEGQGKLMGHTIKYGGAIGGFVLIFGLLNYSFTTIKSSIEDDDTTVEINGDWFIKLTPYDSATNYYGRVHISQQIGGDYFELRGEIRNSVRPQA